MVEEAFEKWFPFGGKWPEQVHFHKHDLLDAFKAGAEAEHDKYRELLDEAIKALYGTLDYSLDATEDWYQATPFRGYVCYVISKIKQALQEDE